MTTTYEGYSAFTAPIRLGAKEPDHLTTCNTVKSERVLFAQSSTSRKRPETLHERENRAKKHSAQHLLISRTEVFNSHCSGELDGLVEMTVR